MPEQEKPETMTKEEGLVKKVIEEIVSTEKSYLEGLILLRDEFIKKLKESSIKGDPSVKKFLKLLESINIITTVSETMVKKLEEIQQNKGITVKDKAILVSNELSKYASFMKPYRRYAAGHDEIIRMHNQLYNKNGRYKKIAEQFNTNPSSRGKNLAAYYITPVQRVPRYKLLLKELQEKYAKAFPGEKNIQRIGSAQETFGSLATSVNEATRQAELTKKDKELLKSLSSWNPETVDKAKRITLRVPENRPMLKDSIREYTVAVNQKTMFKLLVKSKGREIIVEIKAKASELQALTRQEREKLFKTANDIGENFVLKAQQAAVPPGGLPKGPRPQKPSGQANATKVGQPASQSGGPQERSGGAPPNPLPLVTRGGDPSLQPIHPARTNQPMFSELMKPPLLLGKPPLLRELMNLRISVNGINILKNKAGVTHYDQLTRIDENIRNLLSKYEGETTKKGENSPEAIKALEELQKAVKSKCPSPGEDMTNQSRLPSPPKAR